jgi:hypothetical protein
MSPPTSLDKWLKKTTRDDTGLTRPPVGIHVSVHKDEVRSIIHGYFQSQFRVPVYKWWQANTRFNQTGRSSDDGDECFHDTVHHPHRHKRTSQVTQMT